MKNSKQVSLVPFVVSSPIWNPVFVFFIYSLIHQLIHQLLSSTAHPPTAHASTPSLQKHQIRPQEHQTTNNSHPPSVPKTIEMHSQRYAGQSTTICRTKHPFTHIKEQHWGRQRWKQWARRWRVVLLRWGRWSNGKREEVKVKRVYSSVERGWWCWLEWPAIDW